MKLLMENWRNFVSDTEQSLLNEKKDRRRKFADDKGLDEGSDEDYRRCVNRLEMKMPTAEAEKECGRKQEPERRSRSIGRYRGPQLDEGIELVDEGIMSKLKKTPRALRRKFWRSYVEKYIDSKFGWPTFKELTADDPDSLPPQKRWSAPLEEELDEDIELYEEDDLAEGGKCTGPTKKASSTSKGKKWMQCVKNPDGGGYKRVHWGQKGVRVTGKSGNTKRKKSFRARHGCSKAKAGTPKAQACKDW